MQKIYSEIYLCFGAFFWGGDFWVKDIFLLLDVAMFNAPVLAGSVPCCLSTV